MRKIFILGGGWAGCSAALIAAKQGAQVTLAEKTDLLLGAGNAGGIMRNNGRFTAAEENIALGAGEMFQITDRYAVHRNVDFPGHEHASFYDITKVEPAVRRLLADRGVEVRLCCRAIDVKWEPVSGGEGGNCTEKDRKQITAVKTLKAGPVSSNEQGQWEEADVFVEATGSSGPMGNCMRYGNGCAMCVQRCPAFGPRVSLTARAGAADLAARRESGRPGALSGSCKLEKKSLSRKIQKKLSRDGYVVIPLPQELIQKGKLKEKVCQQYALDAFAENLILIDTGEAKLMTPFFPLEKLRMVEGFEEVRFLDPCSGGQGNSVRYMSVGMREDTMRAAGFENLFLAGEKSGFFVGHTEAITTGSLAGYNAARLALPPEVLPHEALPPEVLQPETLQPETLQPETLQPETLQPETNASAEKSGLLILPGNLAVGELLAYAQEALPEEDGLYRRFTFAGGEFFQHMKEKGLYRTEPKEIRKVVEHAGLLGIYEKQET
ncbi:MAG: FAD-dependent oxidoreductase [Anaerovoracaceae bacterium]